MRSSLVFHRYREHGQPFPYKVKPKMFLIAEEPIEGFMDDTEAAQGGGNGSLSGSVRNNEDSNHTHSDRSCGGGDVHDDGNSLGSMGDDSNVDALHDQGCKVGSNTFGDGSGDDDGSDDGDDGSDDGDDGSDDGDVILSNSHSVGSIGCEVEVATVSSVLEQDYM
jgi:hypothetical protein